MIIRALLILIFIIPVAVSAQEVPRLISLMTGEWQSTETNNKFKMNVTWDSESEEFYGYLTQNGTASARVGFTIAEHIFTARIIEKPMMLVVIQKYKEGEDGNSTKTVWITQQVDIEKSTQSELVVTNPLYGENHPGYKFDRIK